jgi:hypothetical protein
MSMMTPRNRCVKWAGVSAERRYAARTGDAFRVGVDPDGRGTSRWHLVRRRRRLAPESECTAAGGWRLGVKDRWEVMDDAPRLDTTSSRRGRSLTYLPLDWLAVVVFLVLVLAIAAGELSGAMAGLVHNITLGG